MPSAVRFAGPLPLLFALCALAAAATAAAVDPRSQVAGVAQVVEAHYHDPARGREIADGLRADAAQGTFDALHDPRDLATALTGRLRPLDRHFAVRWSPEPASAPGRQEGSPASSAPPLDRSRRGNYGVRRVEVLPGNVGYIDLRQFAHFDFEAPEPPARRAIEAALQLVAHADALVIDLRGNGGGSPAMVGYLASAFTPRGADIYNVFHAREGTTSEAPDDWYPTPRLDTPLYLLTSARTGSAAEAFAYTLQNAGRAIVVGERTAGAANPGAEFDAGHGFRVFVSTGSPVSPVTGRNWEGDGVPPDVAVVPADALSTARMLALEAMLERGPPDAEAVDARWVLEALRAQAAAVDSAPFEDYIGGYGSVAVGTRDGRLFLRNGRRPPQDLMPLGDDLFAVADDPSLRVRFERDARGRVAALETLGSDGRASRFRRGG
ncbi:S41 family peptidase [Luteimonas sp. R10]|uniref:S41 family peptidase n=1 Tax=Luteimonas sp. R10 TaxID=3108176 RepID=UPI0030912C51|nr:S41 family peptidase [Luteimonas sp. R10]